MALMRPIIIIGVTTSLATPIAQGAENPGPVSTPTRFTDKEDRGCNKQSGKSRCCNCVVLDSRNGLVEEIFPVFVLRNEIQEIEWRVQLGLALGFKCDERRQGFEIDNTSTYQHSYLHGRGFVKKSELGMDVAFVEFNDDIRWCRKYGNSKKGNQSKSNGA
ncbi:hypothetical protein GGX14DRAFT_656944 [Mycena pura]|uniref:Uncharacterized protein n=1 Tax=Mycena pura TaxID=153505 RepID=A0AAD7E0M8_9AGAR|nr:hypothetical protein GGX14DRAFT_656944 [Mycena pura]